MSTRKCLPLLERIAARRECGTCDACCTTHGVDEISKPAAVQCKFIHASPEGACSIYEARPKSCREWSCLWRLGLFAAGDRPDKLGVVIDVTGRVPGLWPGPTHQAFIARAAHPSSFEDPQTRAWLATLAESSVAILIIDARNGRDARRVLIGPPDVLESVQARMLQLREGG